MHKTNVPSALWQKYAHMCTFLLQNGALWDLWIRSIDMMPMRTSAEHQFTISNKMQSILSQYRINMHLGTKQLLNLLISHFQIYNPYGHAGNSLLTSVQIDAYFFHKVSISWEKNHFFPEIQVHPTASIPNRESDFHIITVSDCVL